jgi:hypothetical protein
MVTLASSGVVLVLSLLAQQPTPPSIDQSAPGERFEIPANIQASDDMKDLLTTLLARSPTLREQCARIAVAPQARIVIDVIGHRLGAFTRARATARRYDSGLLTVVVELPAVSIADFAELLAHELEHVIELIDNVDLAEMVRQGSDGVTQNHEGLFETERAQAAGRAAAAEVFTDTDPTAAAIGRGVANAARLAWRGLKGVAGGGGRPARQ